MKSLIILVGASGSGKSSWSRGRLASGQAVVCSADDGLIDSDGVYRFAPEKLGAAHAACQAKARAAMGRGVPLVVIDNTNTSISEIGVYLNLGDQFEYFPEVLVFDSEHDSEVLAARNRHGVPAHVILNQLARIEGTLANWPESFPMFKRIV